MTKKCRHANVRSLYARAPRPTRSYDPVYVECVDCWEIFEKEE